MAKKSVKKPAKKSAPRAAKTKSAKPTIKKAGKKAAATAKVKAKSKPAPSKKATPGAKPTKLSVAGVKLGAVKVASPAKTDVRAVFSPLDDRVIVEEVVTELRTPGGLFIPDTVAQPSGPKEGKVLAVGRGHRDRKGRMRPLDVKLGDTVLFEAYMGSPLKIGDRDVVVLRESQLLGVVSH